LRLPSGKVPPEVLREIVFRHLGVESRDVLLGPSMGEDGAVIKVGDEVLVSSMDPITGAVKRLGWLAVNINANDVATFGVRPRFFSSCILLPSEAASEILKEICAQIDSAAKRLGIAVIGGHSEVTPGLKQPIVIGYALGVAEEGRYVTSGGARAGNVIILTKGAGVEGTAILASERREILSKELGEDLVNSAEDFYERISVVEEALIAFRVGGVTAMHDPTEGGVAGGIHEVADASNLGVEVFEEKIEIAPETSMICAYFGVDPLQLIGSGALLISVESDYAERVLKAINSRGISASVIGRFLPDPKRRILVQRDGRVTDLVRPLSDHLWKALER